MNEFQVPSQSNNVSRAPAQIELDNPLERLPRDELAALAKRVFEILPTEDPLAPVDNDQLGRFAAGKDLGLDELALLKPLAAWVSTHSETLTEAYPGPKPPLNHLHGCWSNFYSQPLNGVPFPRDLPAAPTRLLDFELDFPIGVPACALTPQHDYVGYFADRGFDLITFKTVRDRPWNPHAFPQWAFAPGIGEPLPAYDPTDPVHPTLDPGVISDVRSASLVNSFGVPSLAPEQWKRHVELSRSRMRPKGQVLIVSVMGSPEAPDTQRDGDAALVSQFARTAAEAEDAGAQIVELNLSCPNTGNKPICQDPELSASVVAAVQKELTRDTPIFIKIGYLAPPQLQALLSECEKRISGVVAINAMPIRSLQMGQEKPFFPDRLTLDDQPTDQSGLSGVAIRDFGLEVTRNLVELRRSMGDWAIVGVGGVTAPEDFQAYRDLGADAVQTCSGAWLNHMLAIETRRYVHGGKSQKSAAGGSSSNAPDHPSQRDSTSAPPRGGSSWRKAVRATFQAIGTGGVSVVTGPSPKDAQAKK